MVTIDTEKCNGCGNCERDCPLAAIKILQKKAVAEEHCVQCGVCIRVCKAGALTLPPQLDGTAATCTSCPVRCNVRPGFYGACHRYLNRDGVLARGRELVLNPLSIKQMDRPISRPLITGVGAGTTYPCCRPAPFIVQDTVDGVDVVTVVTEAPLSYSGVKIKVDTNYFIGEEGAKVRCRGLVVGRVETEEYGSKMIAVGGANQLTGTNGFITARTIVELCNGERISLKVEKGALLELQVGHRPVINGIEDTKMRFGCGSATIGIFAEELATAVDEAIILDHHVVGLLSEHLAGEYAGMKWSGVVPNARKSTRGRYFGEHGSGWGGTNIENPRDAVLKIDPTVATPGMKILITETTGQRVALFTLDKDYELVETPLTPQVKETVDLIASSCQEARVSAVYSGGTGGSARGGVTKCPIKLTQAVHRGEANLTIGGAPTFILPGGGINFLVDVEKVVPGAFSWVPTPATVAPVEYTVSRKKYEEMGGHLESIIQRSELKPQQPEMPPPAESAPAAD